MTVTWQDPPPRRRRPGKPGRWQLKAAELTQHPGRSQLVLENAPEAAADSCYASLRKAGCVATRRQQDDGTYCVWAWWAEATS